MPSSSQLQARSIHIVNMCFGVQVEQANLQARAAEARAVSLDADAGALQSQLADEKRKAERLVSQMATLR